ncbi:MAG: putative porin, partial [Nitrososphaera sp.]|nr:putative porin [Nitrososphaera sp.]
MDAQDAVMYGSQGVGVNLVTRQHNNNRPITKLRYMQGPFEYGLTDGMFAQNILRGTNLMVGLQRHTTDGRFTNSAYDSWNIRSQLRYNVSDRFNIAASYFYHSADNGQNNGIDTSSPSLFNEVDAIVHDSTAHESTSRHDFAITGIARLFPDSTSITQFSLFSMESDREYTDSLKVQGSSSLMGGRVLQRFSIKSLSAALGLDIIRESSSGYTWYKQGERNRSAFFGKLELLLLGRLNLAASFRTELQANRRGTISNGLSFQLHINEHINLWGNLSAFAPYQLPWTLEYFSAGIDLRANNSTVFSISAYTRSHEYPLPYSRLLGNDLTGWTIIPAMSGATGGSALLSAKFWQLESILTGTMTIFDNEYPVILTTSFPKWIATGEFAYRDVILTDVMELRTGVRFKYASPYQGVGYNSRYALFVPNTGARIDESFTLDLFAVAHLGDAYLTLSWENILNEGYVTVARYPMPGRTFRFGFNWTFFD